MFRSWDSTEFEAADSQVANLEHELYVQERVAPFNTPAEPTQIL